jgi:hypothetical protein
MALKSHALPLCIAFASLLLGCAGTAIPPVDTKPTDPKPLPDKSKTPLSEVHFKDAGLQKCVDQVAARNNWKTLGEVTSLNCFGQEKNRFFFSDSDWVIHDLSGLEQLTALKKLEIPGHFYTQIDTSALTQLETLNVYEAFIKNLDVSKNTKLKSLNVGATAIVKLDLSGLKNMEELYVYFWGAGNTIYTEWCIRDFGKDLGLTVDMLKNLKKEIVFDRDAKLKIVEAGDNALVDLPNNSQLSSATGQFTARSITGAKLLKIMTGKISGDTLLDVSTASQLERVDINSDELKDVRVNTAITSLAVNAPLTSLRIPANAKLKTMDLKNIKMETALDVSKIDALESLSISSEVLRDIKIGTNLNALSFDGPLTSLNFPVNTKLTQLQLRHLKNTAVVEVGLPPKLTSLYLSDTNSRGFDLRNLSELQELHVLHSEFSSIELPRVPVFLDVVGKMPVYLSPIESVTAISLSLDEADSSCTFMSGASYPNLKSLIINGCASKAMNLREMPNLTLLNLNMPNLKSISFLANTMLTDITIQSGQLSDVDVAPFQGETLEHFEFHGSMAPDTVTRLSIELPKIFKRWSLWLDEGTLIGVL